MSIKTGLLAILDLVRAAWLYWLVGIIVVMIGGFLHNSLDTVTDTPGGFIELIGIGIILYGGYKGI